MTAKKAKGYLQGDLNEQVRLHTPLVRRIASHIGSRLPANVSLDDLIQEGLFGLLDALKNYESLPNQSFEAYASMRIRGAIYDACRRNDLLPRGQRDKVDLLEKTSRKLEQSLGRAASHNEVADSLGLSMDEFHEILEHSVYLAPIDDIPEHALPIDESNSPLAMLESRQFIERVVEVLKRLPEKQQLMMTLHYQEDLSYREIAAVMDLTPGRISQLHTLAMMEIRKSLREAAPEFFKNDPEASQSL